jgi:hypothetical protein
MPITTFDGETRFQDIQLNKLPTAPLVVGNPEFDYKTRINSENIAPPENSIKLRENPKVSVAAHKTFNYNHDENMQTNRPFFRKKIEPVKSYSSGLNRGTILTSGVEQPKIGRNYFTGKRLPTSIPTY